jgi:hypothetical protein
MSSNAFGFALSFAWQTSCFDGAELVSCKAVMYCFLLLVRVPAQALEEFGADCVVRFVAEVLMYAVPTSVVGFALVSLMVTAARSNIAVSVSRATRSAACNMIKSICDVVVELDANYKLDKSGFAGRSVVCWMRSGFGRLIFRSTFCTTANKSHVAIIDISATSIMRGLAFEHIVLDVCLLAVRPSVSDMRLIVENMQTLLRPQDA